MWYAVCRKTAVSVEASDAATLRSELTERQNKIVWTDDIEGDLLGKKAGPVAGIARDIKIVPEALSAMSPDFRKPVYPFIDGFYSLDTSGIGTEQRAVMDGFCSAIRSGAAADRFMTPDAIFSLALFLADLKVAFPDGKDTVFTASIYGKPFIDDGLFQVPVRFVNLSGTLDAMLFLNQKYDWRIDQIQIKGTQVKQNERTYRN